MIINKKNLVNHFPVTIAAIWLFTLLTIVGISDMWEWVEDSTILLFYFGFGSFLTEAFYLQKKKTIGFFAGLAGAAVFALFFTVWRHFRWEEGTIWGDWNFFFERYAVGYVLFALSLGIFLCYWFGSKNGIFNFADYLVRVFAGFVRASLIYTVLMIGSLMIVGIIMELFDIEFELLLRVEILILGGYYVPALLVCVFPEKEEKSRLTGFLIKYVLTGMVMCAVAVIYIYMLKILITFDMPSNAVFRIVAWLFVLGVPVCTMNGHYQEGNPLKKVSTVLVYMMLPLVLMQSFSIIVRIREHGLTPMRYLCIALLLFEVMVLILYYVKRNRLGIMMGVIPIAIIVSCFLPFINMDYVSYLNQKTALEKVLSLSAGKQEALSEETYEHLLKRAKGAYEYLEDNEYAKDYIARSKDQVKEVLSKVMEEEKEPATIYYMEHVSPNEFSVSGYDKFYPVRHTVNRDTEDIGSGYVILLGEETYGKEVRLELKDFLEPYKKYADEDGDFSTYFRTHSTYQMNEQYQLLLDDLSFAWDVEEEKLTRLYINGYLLEKTANTEK
ncbi:MAG: DUF4153 domain-containing protein [Lachnospiraceae bacterium]|nr:DUF4153 domain-containing protein [Lachnospiraceae bacterium]